MRIDYSAVRGPFLAESPRIEKKMIARVDFPSPRRLGLVEMIPALRQDHPNSDTAMPSWAQIQELAERVGGGETSAWPEMMAALEPKLSVLVRYQRIGRLRSREDDLRNIVVAVFERLARREFHALARFVQIDAGPSFEAWIRRVVRSVAIDYLRGHPEYQRHQTGSTGRWVTLAELSTGLAADPSSGAEKRRAVLTALGETVTACRSAALGEAEIGELATALGIEPIHVRRAAERGERLQNVVTLLLSGHRHAAIAEQLGLTRREVELAIKHAEELLIARRDRGGQS